VTDPKCFISYSWDSDQHKAWVRRLAEELQGNGVYVHLDQWDVRLGHDLPHYMETCVRESQFVLLICTPKFARKANSGNGGVGYEKSIVTGEIFLGVSDDTKFVPVLRLGLPAQALPSYLRSKAFVDMRLDTQFNTSLEEILRHIFDTPIVTRPILGAKPTFTRIQHTSNRIERFRRTAVADVARVQQGSFDLESFENLLRYAQNTLFLDRTPATEWAEAHIRDDPPFDFERFENLLRYAQNTLFLGMTPATEWAEAHIRDDPPFDFERFENLLRYAQNTLFLDMTPATEWAEAHIRDDPPFDFERFENLLRYAQNTLFLGMTPATEWAEAHIGDDPPFDFERFENLLRYAQNTLFLDMTTATEWAEKHYR
jgi:TIR domain